MTGAHYVFPFTGWIIFPSYERCNKIHQELTLTGKTNKVLTLADFYRIVGVSPFISNPYYELTHGWRWPFLIEAKQWGKTEFRLRFVTKERALNETQEIKFEKDEGVYEEAH